MILAQTPNLKVEFNGFPHGVFLIKIVTIYGQNRPYIKVFVELAVLISDRVSRKRPSLMKFQC